jgi:hypothetical protein
MMAIRRVEFDEPIPGRVGELRFNIALGEQDRIHHNQLPLEGLRIVLQSKQQQQQQQRRRRRWRQQRHETETRRLHAIRNNNSVLVGQRRWMPSRAIVAGLAELLYRDLVAWNWDWLFPFTGIEAFICRWKAVSNMRKGFYEFRP